MTMGLFGAFIILLFKLYDPVRKFAYFYNSFQQAMGASSSIFAFFDAEDDVMERPHAARASRVSGSPSNLRTWASPTRPKRASTRFCTTSTWRCRAGEVLALVGPSGAGKSTLVNLIPRFFDVTSGRILIDGHDLRDLTLASLRRQVAQVTQETILFNDTVRNNIAYGQPERRLAGGAGGAQRPGARLHSAHAAGLRHGDRRKRFPALGRRAPADGHRARHPQGCADSDSGRGHFGAGRRERVAGAGRAGQPDAGAHGDGDRAPAVDHSPRQSHRGDRGRAHHRNRLARRSVDCFADLSAAVPTAIY